MQNETLNDILFDLYKQSAEVGEIYAALSQAQGEMKFAKKDSENPFFKSTYADLAAVLAEAKEPLARNGLALTQHPVGQDGLVSVLTHKSGQFIMSAMRIKGKDDSPQARGSAITYSKRYAAQAILGMPSDDDDGEGAEGRSQEKPKPKGEVVNVAKVVEKPKTQAPKPVPSIAEKISKMVKAFAEKSINLEMLEARLGHKIELTSAKEIDSLKEIYSAIDQDYSKLEIYFAQKNAIPAPLQDKPAQKTVRKGDQLSHATLDKLIASPKTPDAIKPLLVDLKTAEMQPADGLELSRAVKLAANGFKKDLENFAAKKAFNLEQV